jgi:hypothetical protein
MAKYGKVAVEATVSLQGDPSRPPRDAWQAAARKVFPTQTSSQEKGCPRSAYLGLCEDGLVVGVQRGDYGAGTDNKAYAVQAVQLLTQNPDLEEVGASSLWRRVMNGRDKKANSQMDVVLSLWAHGLITR